MRRMKILALAAGVGLLALATTACSTLAGAAIGAGSGAAISAGTGHDAARAH